MKDKDLKNFKPNGGIRPSPLKVHNGLIADILHSPNPQTGQKRDIFFARISQGDIPQHNHHNFVPDKTIYRNK